MIRAGAYLRYSSDKQRPSSNEDQRRRVEELCARRGFALVSVWADEEMPGAIAEARPGYQALLAAVRTRQIDVVVVDEQSRLSRIIAEVDHLRQVLEFYQVGLVTVAGGIDTLTAPDAAPALMLLGGLHILGTERHESRRIDNQLRGRAGRQGDPGSSRFYVSFEDELMRLFGPERLEGLLSRWPENEPLEMKMTTRMIENAQKKVEAHNFEIRRHQLQYDDVMNHQRAIIYEQRMRVLRGQDMRESVLAHINQYIEERVKEYANRDIHPSEWNLPALRQVLAEVSGVDVTEEQMAEFQRPDDLTQFLQDELLARYEAREQEIGPEAMRELERYVTLRVVSMRWVDHLAAMEDLQEGIGLRGYSGTDPLILYQKESYEYWLNLLATIREDIIRYLYHITVEAAEKQEQQYASATPHGVPVQADDTDGMVAPEEGESPVAAPRPPATATRPIARRAAEPGRKVGRNDPCPCGSGKKYKKCCGRGK